MVDVRGPSVRQRRLAAELRRLREQAGLTLEDVAERLGKSRATISRLETARTRLKPRDVQQLCELFDTSQAEVDALVALARDAGVKDWWQPYRDVMAGAYIALETEAAGQRSYEAELVPGLLQTPEYTRAVIRAGRPTAGPNELDRRIELRLKRQEALDREPPLQVWAVVNEAVLHRVVGDRRTMREQLVRLADAAERPNVELQVLRYEVGAHAAMAGPFILLDFAEHPTVGYIDTLGGPHYVEPPGDVDKMTVVFDQLRAQALDPGLSAQAIRRRASDLE